MKKTILMTCLTILMASCAFAQPDKFVVIPSMVELKGEEGIEFIEEGQHKFMLDLRDSTLRLIMKDSEGNVDSKITDVYSYRIIESDEHNMYLYELLTSPTREGKLTKFDIGLKRDNSWGGVWVENFYFQGGTVKILQ